MLEDGRPARTAALAPGQRKILDSAQLLTSKPTLVVCNVSEETAGTECAMSRAVADAVAARKDWDNVEVVRVCAKVCLRGVCVSQSDGTREGQLEDEVARLESEESRTEYLAEFGLKETGLDRIISGVCGAVECDVT